MIHELIVLQTLYLLLLNSGGNKVSLVRLQNEINNNILIEKIAERRDTMIVSIHEILEIIKQLFPNQTSLTEGQLTFYNLQLRELRAKLLEIYGRFSDKTIEEIKELEENITKAQGELDGEDSRGKKLLHLYSETLIKKFREYKYSSLYENAVVEQNAPQYYESILRPVDLKKLKSEGVSNLLELQKGLQLCVANATMYNKSGSEVWSWAKDTQEDLQESVEFVKSTLE